MRQTKKLTFLTNKSGWKVFLTQKHTHKYTHTPRAQTELRRRCWTSMAPKESGGILRLKIVPQLVKMLVQRAFPLPTDNVHSEPCSKVGLQKCHSKPGSCLHLRKGLFMFCCFCTCVVMYFAEPPCWNCWPPAQAPTEPGHCLKAFTTALDGRIAQKWERPQHRQNLATEWNELCWQSWKKSNYNSDLSAPSGIISAPECTSCWLIQKLRKWAHSKPWEAEGGNCGQLSGSNTWSTNWGLSIILPWRSHGKEYRTLNAHNTLLNEYRILEFWMPHAVSLVFYGAILLHCVSCTCSVVHAALLGRVNAACCSFHSIVSSQTFVNFKFSEFFSEKDEKVGRPVAILDLNKSLLPCVSRECVWVGMRVLMNNVFDDVSRFLDVQRRNFAENHVGWRGCCYVPRSTPNASRHSASVSEEMNPNVWGCSCPSRCIAGRGLMAIRCFRLPSNQSVLFLCVQLLHIHQRKRWCSEAVKGKVLSEHWLFAVKWEAQKVRCDGITWRDSQLVSLKSRSGRGTDPNMNFLSIGPNSSSNCIVALLIW